MTVTAMSDSLAYAAIPFPWGQWIRREYSTEYTNAANIIYRRANYNANAWRNTIPFLEDYNIDQVCRIMDAYGQGVTDGKITAYDDRADASEKDIIYDYVASKSGESRDLTRVVLYEMYWAAYGKPQEISGNLIVNPTMVKETRGGPLDQGLDALNVIKWLAIIGIGAYALAQVNVALKTVKTVKD